MKIIIRKSKTKQEGQGQAIAILTGTRFRVVDSLGYVRQSKLFENHAAKNFL